MISVPGNSWRPLARLALWFLALRFLLAGIPATGIAQTPSGWLIHDLQRPQPPVVTPAPQPLPLSAPADAHVLFDGSDLSQWRSADGGPAKWVVRDGYLESVPDSGYLFSADGFGDIQLHLEWASPSPPQGRSQQRGNSGLFLMSMYELQVLDSYRSETYPDGQAAAIYGQFPPLVNACLPPGEWQSYDVVFRRPRFNQQGNLLSPARLTLLHNGVLVQENRELWGPTSWLKHRPYQPHPDRLPLGLQDHGNPVRYRNIWLRELADPGEAAPARPSVRPYHRVALAELDCYVGKYMQEDGTPTDVVRDGASLWLEILGREPLELVPAPGDEFFLRWTAGKVVFQTQPQRDSTTTPIATSPDGNASGGKDRLARVATQLTLHLGGRTYPATRQSSSRPAE